MWQSLGSHRQALRSITAPMIPSPPPFVVDEEGKLMNFLDEFSGKGGKKKMKRPYVYYCHDCETNFLFPERVYMKCFICGASRLVRVVVANGDLMWIK